ncbi:MAG TPA: helix-turn-helix transcriptional regulator [Clostridia bacterium]|jgi:transcriptional regulator with XRE-family HTH domain|nr:helix-turn-helix transcriptional regulator [Clostridia bacterium]
MFGEFLISLRSKYGVKQYQLAKQIGVSAPYLSDLERNRRNPPSYELLKKIQSALGLSTDESNMLFDFAAKYNETTPYDIAQYIKDFPTVAKIIRYGKKYNYTAREWERILRELRYD